ncbi:hypothetical protein LCGC14_2538550 [marine sediment metagenome]|uniref:Uncharacterized protein n=1 Tax=marine sediment metagenome TaxID=412755 RepID=A0A0F9ARE9_9ZZZZ
MSIEDKPEFQEGLKKLKDNFRENLLDHMTNDEGWVEVIWDDASEQTPGDLQQDQHMSWQETLVGHLEMWVEEQLQTEVSGS